MARRGSSAEVRDEAGVVGDLGAYRIATATLARLRGRLTPSCPARLSRIGRAVGALGFSLLASTAGAQTVPRQNLGPLLQPGQGRPIPEVPATPNFDFSIEAPRRSPVPRAVEELSFEIKDIRIVGSTVYTPDQLRPTYAALLGHSVHLSDIVGIADKIEGKYRTDGYVLTRAFVPPQSVSNGVFQINVVEGYVEAVSVEGGDESTRDRVRAIVAPVTASRPLQLKVIESALLRANQLPGTGAAGLLRPSPTTPGASDLAVTVTGAPVTAVLSVDDRGTRLTSRWTEEADVAVLLDHGDQVQLTVQKAPIWTDRHMLSGKVTHPIGTDGMTVSVNGLVSNSNPRGGSLGSATLPTNSESFGARAAYPILVTRENVLSVDGGFTIESTRVNESSEGGNTLHDAWRTIDVAFAYQNIGFLNGITSASLDVTHGLSIFGATNSYNSNATRTGGQPDFTKFSTVLRRTQPLWGPISAAITGIGQYSLNTLMLGEEVSFGGVSGLGGDTSGIGRGYDPAALTGDSGAGGAFELRYDDRPAFPFVNSAQYYVFYDTARIWNHKAAPPTEDTLQSAGAGVRLAMERSVSLGFEVAHTFTPLQTNDVQNNGTYTRETRILFNGVVKF